MMACKPEKEDTQILLLEDTRLKFVGQYKVVEKIYSYGDPKCGSYSSTRDTIISVKTGATDSTIAVLGRDVYLDSNNEYYAYHYGLQFRNDSIFSTYMNGGLGCGQYEVYTGVKLP